MIEHTYNRRRRQRVLGKLTPVEYELAFIAPDNADGASGSASAMTPSTGFVRQMEGA